MEQGTKPSCRKGAAHLKWKSVLVALAGMAMCCASAQVMAQEDAVSLSQDDCQKCHDNAPKDIEARGGKHKTAVGCMDCHQGHPPKNQDIIPECSMCHMGKEHFELDDCLRCHSNPHAPLDLQLAGGITDPCLTCHTRQREQLEEHESSHTGLDCTSCHSKHGLIPECIQCHEPHSDKMGQEDCGRCHQAHMPLVVTYSEDIANIHCAACHDDAYELLKNSPTKHGDLNCATCHQAKHKMVPKCQDCHGEPHPESILSKFETCGDCHGIAHDLNSGRNS